MSVKAIEQSIESVENVQDAIDVIVDDSNLGYNRLINDVSQEDFEDYGAQLNLLNEDDDTVIRVIQIPEDKSKSKLHKDLQSGGVGRKELFSIVVRTKDSDSPLPNREISDDEPLTFFRVERRKSTERVDIEHDLQYFEVDVNDVEPMYLDHFDDLRLRGRDYDNVSSAMPEVFSLKKITNKFYEDFSDIFHDRLKPAVNGLEDKDENLNSYTQLVVNRVLFLMFIQKKGWLNENKTYIQDRYVEVKESDNHVYEDFFKPLFFEALRNKDTPDGLGRIPYLNGGLFEKREEEENVVIDEDFFDALLDPEEDEYKNKKGFLLRYKISLKESNPSEQELVVDPEFIGHIFEKFMTEEERKDEGAFYTPKEITQYMSKNALKHYLLEDFSDREEEISELVSDYSISEDFDEDELEKLRQKTKDVDVVDPAVGSGAFIISMLEELIGVTESLNEKLGYEEDRFELKEEFIARSLYGVDIDPSGIELCKFRTWLHLMQDLDVGLDEFLENNEKYALPNLGFKFFVGNSLAGDFKPTEIRDVLDNIGSGDGGGDSMQTTINARKTEESERDLSDIVDEVDEKRRDYLDAHGDEKDRLEKELQELIEEIDGLIDWESSDYWMDEVVESAGNSFKWSVNIPEVILEGGFDIVIGNPPYRGGEEPTYLTKLSHFLEESLEYYKKPIRKDLYQKFILRGFELLRTGGTISYITSNTFYTIDSKKPVRHVLQNNRTHELVLANPNTFDATVSPAIFLTTKEDMSNTSYELYYIDASKSDISAYHTLVREKELGNQGFNSYRTSVSLYKNSMGQSFFAPNETNLEIYDRFMSDLVELEEKWEDVIIDIDRLEENIERIKSQHLQQIKPGNITLLGLLTRGGVGLQTGGNEEYLAYLDGTSSANKVKRRNDDFKYVDKNENKYNWISRVIKKKHVANVSSLSEDEKRNGITSDDTEIWVPYEKGFKKEEIYYSPTEVYINWSKESVNRIKNDRNGRLRRTYYYFDEGLFASRGGFAEMMVRYVNNSVIDNTGFVLLPFYDRISAKYLCGVLNSSFIDYYVDTFINSSGKQVADMRRTPIICPTTSQREEMEELVDKAIEVKKGNSEISIENVQREIDELTEEIYDVERYRNE